MKKIINTKKVLILEVIVAIILLTNISYAKFANEIVGVVNAKIAQPIIELETNEEVSINNENLRQEYYFNVKNFNDIRTNIAMNYYLELESNSLNEISYSLYKDGEEVRLKDNKTEMFKLSNILNECHEYKLIIELKNNDLIEEESKINLKIHSEQENNQEEI